MKTLYMFFYFVYFGIAILNAQKLDPDYTNRIVINNSDLPMISQCPENIDPGYWDPKKEINGDASYCFPAKKFEVSTFNSAKQTWIPIADIAKYCQNKSENGSNWRLPNQKELFIIYILRAAIDNKNIGDKFKDAYYVTGLFSNSTDYNQNKIDMSNGNSSSGSLQDGYYIRCVRDIIP